MKLYPHFQPEVPASLPPAKARRVPLLPMLNITLDTREPDPHPWVFTNRVVVSRACLHEGDAALTGLERLGVFERKTPDDLVGSVTHERSRLLHEFVRLEPYDFKAIIVEGSMLDIEQHRYHSKASPQSVIGSLVAFWVDFGVAFVFAGSPEGAAVIVEKTLRRLHERHLEKKASAA